MAQDPAILFYTSDFLVGTTLMDYSQKGKYITLICLQHQIGHLSAEDMLKICQTHDKDIFDKFRLDDDGRYYNKRMEEEINKRKNYSNSRKTNRLSKKEEKKPLTHVDDMLNTSKSHVPHMENEIIINSIVDNKDNTTQINNNNNNKDMKNISSTHDVHMSKICENEQVDYYIGNWTLATNVENCLKYYSQHTEFEVDRGYGLELFKKQYIELPVDEIFERLFAWGKKFNEANIGKFPERSMRGDNSWVQHFHNWLNKKNLSENPISNISNINKKFKEKTAHELLAIRK